MRGGGIKEEDWLEEVEVKEEEEVEEELVEYRANVALVVFNSLHLGGLGQRGPPSQILLVLNLHQE